MSPLGEEPVQANTSPSPLWLQGATPEPAEVSSTTVDKDVAQRKAALREATRYRNLARAQRRLRLFYLEHNLFAEAQATRLVMLDYLRSATHQWRCVLGRTDP